MFLLRILFGGAFTIAASYSLGRVCLWRMRGPRVMSLPVGAAILSVCVFFLMLLEAANETSFLTLGVCALLPLLWRGQRPPPEGKKQTRAPGYFLLRSPRPPADGLVTPAPTSAPDRPAR